MNIAGYRWRTFTLEDPTTGYWIRTAQREDVRSELSQEIAIGNILPIVIALPLLVIAVIIAVQIGFRPLRKLEKPVRHMAPERIQPDNNGYSIRICDQGSGIPAADRERALSRFIRLDQRQGLCVTIWLPATGSSPDSPALNG